MRKLYYMLCRLIGYTLIFEHTWNSNFELETKYSHLVIYKHMGLYNPKYGGMKLKRFLTIKIR